MNAFVKLKVQCTKTFTNLELGRTLVFNLHATPDLPCRQREGAVVIKPLFPATTEKASAVRSGAQAYKARFLAKGGLRAK